jgi:hypothetical protein
LKKDPSTLFDQKAILTQARPGMIATDNTDPVFLVFARLTGSSVDTRTGGSAVAVCRGREELAGLHEEARVCAVFPAAAAHVSASD